MPGPFHRCESPTQTREDALKQVSSGEIWGKAARYSGMPSVKAYTGSLQTSARGIEFVTSVAPDLRSSSPFEARWYHPQTPGVVLRTANAVDYAAIPAKVENKQP